MKCDVYYNLNKRTFSVRYKGKVIRHSDLVFLENPKFIVSEKGRQRVLKKRRKNVHAVVRGEVLFSRASAKSQEWEGLTDRNLKKTTKQAYYNPYRTKTFVDYHSGKELASASFVVLKKTKYGPTIFYND